MCGPYGREDGWWKPYDKEITKAFNKFAGKEINPSNPGDPVLKEMQKEAAMHYSYLRLVPEGADPARDDAKITRISAELVDAGDGKWKVGNRFFRG
jgi:hypothetical protein